ncbi:Uncharacterised protein [Elizabethkingia meningoseptica]|nr:Uncharacterised protein [Elizabethkingia meningoseptica]
MIIFLYLVYNQLKYYNMKTLLSNAKLLDKKGLKQIMGGYVCQCGRPCPDPNQPPPKECD